MVETQNHRIVQVPEEVSAPPEGDRHALETIERLKRLASRLHEFMLTQIDRLECDSRHGVGAREESVLARQVEEFRQERESWELHRHQEVEQLRSEGMLLTEAWQRLEAEERRLLAERELLRRSAINSQESTLSCNAALPTSRGGAAYSAGGKRQTTTNDQEHIAWLQFQQLRREIQKYGRRAT